MNWLELDDGQAPGQNPLRRYDFMGRPVPEGQPDPSTEEPSELEAAIVRWLESLQ